MTGSTKDPVNGPEVAASVFAAVVVYAVRPSLPPRAKPQLRLASGKANTLVLSSLVRKPY